jgi:hypothetical protein
MSGLEKSTGAKRQIFWLPLEVGHSEAAPSTYTHEDDPEGGDWVGSMWAQDDDMNWTGNPASTAEQPPGYSAPAEPTPAEPTPAEPTPAAAYRIQQPAPRMTESHLRTLNGLRELNGQRNTRRTAQELATSLDLKYKHVHQQLVVLEKNDLVRRIAMLGSNQHYWVTTGVEPPSAASLRRRTTSTQYGAPSASSAAGSGAYPAYPYSSSAAGSGAYPAYPYSSSAAGSSAYPAGSSAYPAGSDAYSAYPYSSSSAAGSSGYPAHPYSSSYSAAASYGADQQRYSSPQGDDFDYSGLRTALTGYLHPDDREEPNR